MAGMLSGNLSTMSYHERETTDTHPGRPGGPGSEPSWIKSSLSFSNGNCVEVAGLPDGRVGVRHSKESEGPVLRFTPDEWRAFLGGVRNGEFDRFCGH
jgi:hypothetical protein